MGKFLVRITVLFTAFYLLVCFYMAQFEGVDMLDDWYSVLFEAIVVVYAYSEGKYHCRHLKHLAFAVFFSDVLCRLDNRYNFLSVSEHNLIPICLLIVGITVSTFSALRHFHQVSKVKRNRKKLYEKQNTEA